MHKISISSLLFSDNKTKLNLYSDKYINDFDTVENLDNRTKLETETSYYDYDNTKTVFDNVSLKKDGTEDTDPQKQDIYPDPFVKHLLNKNRTLNKHDDNVIKICELITLNFN